MPIAFCASAQALAACIAQNAPAVDPPIVHCDDLLHAPSDPVLQEIQASAVVLVEAGSLVSSSYQVSFGKVVSMLSMEGRLLLVGPTLLGLGVLQCGAVPETSSAAQPFLVCTLAAAPNWDAVLHSGAASLVLLSGDIYALYDPAGATLTARGQGSLITVAQIRAAGNAPAALEVDVLVPGTGVPWPPSAASTA